MSQTGTSMRHVDMKPEVDIPTALMWWSTVRSVDVMTDGAIQEAHPKPK